MNYKYIKNEAEVIIATLERLISGKLMLISNITREVNEAIKEQVKSQIPHLTDPAEVLAWVNDNYNIRDNKNKSIRTLEIYNYLCNQNIEIKNESQKLKKLHEEAKIKIETNTERSFSLYLKESLVAKINKTYSLSEFEDYADSLTYVYMNALVQRDQENKINFLIDFENLISEKGIRQFVSENINDQLKRLRDKDNVFFHSFEDTGLDYVLRLFFEKNIKLGKEVSLLYCTHYQIDKIIGSIHESNLYSNGLYKKGNANFISSEIEAMYEERESLQREKSILHSLLYKIKDLIDSKFEKETEWKPLYLEAKLATYFSDIPEKFNNINVHIDEYSVGFFIDFILALKVATKSSPNKFIIEENEDEVFYNKLNNFITETDNLLEKNNYESLFCIENITPFLKKILTSFNFLDMNMVENLQNEQLKNILTFKVKLKNFND